MYKRIYCKRSHVRLFSQQCVSNPFFLRMTRVVRRTNRLIPSTVEPPARDTRPEATCSYSLLTAKLSATVLLLLLLQLFYYNYYYFDNCTRGVCSKLVSCYTSRDDREFVFRRRARLGCRMSALKSGKCDTRCKITSIGPRMHGVNRGSSEGSGSFGSWSIPDYGSILQD